MRAGFGRGLLEAGKADNRVWALVADLTTSIKVDGFMAEFPDRYIQVGIAEQNMAAVGAGIAAMGKTPFIISLAAFNPGRNWEQIKTTAAIAENNVKIIGSHAGISVGHDGATHQMLEDIALMRAMPNMMVIAPADSVEAEKATLAMAEHQGPAYMRLAREANEVFTTKETPFSLDKALVIRGGSDISLISTGTMTYHTVLAAIILEDKGISAEVIHVPVIKPLDHVTLLASIEKTGVVVTAEEAQVAGGLGGAVAELVTATKPVPVKRVGMMDKFGESGDPAELMEHFSLTADDIVEVAERTLSELK